MNPDENLLHYRIVEKIGEGGMGVVWKAVDTTLDREVAIKILPDVFAADPERMARFEREAKLLASLNHPNIAAIYGLHQEDNVRFLTMEYVAGEDLSKRLERGQMPLEEALGTALQIAEALEAAHDKGIIHRDLKPANILVTPDDKVKVLDFGLAKVFETTDESAPANPTMSPTLTSAGSVAGVILGTAGYMSPEQARGHTADRRSDVWAFGCVLYEMLGGTRAFSGDTISDTLASVLKLDPDWSSLPADLPGGVQRVVRRCLQKDPKQRLRDVADLRIELQEARAGAPGPDVSMSLSGVATPPVAVEKSRFGLRSIAVGLLALVVGLAAGWSLKPEAPDPPLRRFFIDIQGKEAELDDPMISPDGRRIAYTLDGKVWVRELTEIEPRELDGTDGANDPFWSPDSEHLAYEADGKLWRIPAVGGRPSLVCDLTERLTAGTWAEDGTIAFVLDRGPIWEVAARGGDPQAAVPIDAEAGEIDFHDVKYVPGGRDLLFITHVAEGPVLLQLWNGSERETLFRLETTGALGYPSHDGSGHVVFKRWGTNAGIWALPFSPKSGETTGEAFLVAPAGTIPSVSDDGTLVYLEETPSGDMHLAWVDREGTVESTIGQPQNAMWAPELSPDGRNVVVASKENDEWDLWIHDAQRQTKTRLTFEAEPEGGPAWSPDGKLVYFFHPVFGAEPRIYVIPADGSGQRKQLTEGGLFSVSSDGNVLVFARRQGSAAARLWSLSLDQEGDPVPFLESDAETDRPALSPDGRFLAYASDESGRDEIYVKPFPGGDGKWQVSVNGGDWPVWSRAGDRLYFVNRNTLMEVDVESDPALILGTPRSLVPGAPQSLLFTRGFDIDPEGERFVVVQRSQEEGGDDPRHGIHVVESWYSEFRD